MKTHQFVEYTEGLSPPYRYALATALVVIALQIRLSLLPVTASAKFTAFYPAVVLAFYLFGTGPGLVAIVASTIMGFYFFFPPYSTFIVTPDSALQTTMYFVSVLLCGYFMSLMHDYRQSLLATQNALATQKLEAETSTLSHAIVSAGLGVWRFHPEDELLSISDQLAEHLGLPAGVHIVSYARVRTHNQ